MLIVKKFGGTSLKDVNRLKKVKEIIASYLCNGHQLVIIVSAPAGMTDFIYNQAVELSNGQLIDNPSISMLRECDQALNVGEQINASLLALALETSSIRSISCNAWNLPIFGTNCFGNSEITSINVQKISTYLKQNITPIITGFQAVDHSIQNCFTLGRGGSDYSAVMIAAALHADECYIYTDVEGIFTADPNIIKHAKKIDLLSYEEAIQITCAGAKVLQDKSAVAAQKYNVSLKILSSFNEEGGSEFNGTLIANNALFNRNNKDLEFVLAHKKYPKYILISIIFLTSFDIKLNFESFINYLKDNLRQKNILESNIDFNITENMLGLKFTELDIHLNELLQSIYQMTEDFKKYIIK